jgi:hypothetical protein
MLSNSKVGTYTYPPQGPNNWRPHAVATAGDRVYYYDDNGNQTHRYGPTWSLERLIAYDGENRPTSVTMGATPSHSSIALMAFSPQIAPLERFGLLPVRRFT